ncbi:unnamed protein product [Haemonchus placei]|uniref:Uncharacterized protein n=1 Tax=Haemonchus placei TaxID=6290 RepID=A0A0N4WFP7_HAEPC|nr:unnamed protein product [Haemonchus placei]
MATKENNGADKVTASCSIEVISPAMGLVAEDAEDERTDEERPPRGDKEADEASWAGAGVSASRDVALCSGLVSALSSC